MGPEKLRVLHVNDCAFTTTNLMTGARSRGLPWHYLPLASTEPAWRGLQRSMRRAARGVGWLGQLAGHAARSDLLHIHFATVTRHTSWVGRPTVVHLHGTDARTYQYDVRLGPLVRRAMDSADAVLYSTPDLAPHVRRRPDATLLPVPIDVQALPAWRPAARPRVFFASRWEGVKGLGVQLAVVEAVRRSAPGVDLVGVDWGVGAPAAADAGVRLLPRRPHAEFLADLARAHVVVGQPTGMLAASELEALGMGIPVVAPLHLPWYEESGAAIPPVLGGVDLAHGRPLPPQDAQMSSARSLTGTEECALGNDIADVVLMALSDPEATSTSLASPTWVAAQHGVDSGIERLLPLYARVMDRRGS